MNNSDCSTPEIHRLAAELYADKRLYLLRIARRNAATETDAEEAVQDAFLAFVSQYDLESGAPPLAWVTLATKRRCWRLRDAAHLDRRVVALPETRHEEPSGLIERRPSDLVPLPERIADRDEAGTLIRRLKPDERTALLLKAAGYSYEEIGLHRGWTHTKVNRCIYEGRQTLRSAVAS
jgi:RNA polymerase sigma factor (sigma-70 family)